MTLTKFLVICTWCRSFLHLAYGPVEGEKRYNAISLKNALELWSDSDRKARA